MTPERKRAAEEGHLSPEGGNRIRGLAAYFEPPPDPQASAEEGRRLALVAAKAPDPEAERIYREAIERLVDAFLLARRSQKDCFSEAHRIGRYLQGKYGCPMVPNPDRTAWRVECGVLALHSRIGLSFGGPSVGHCSICEAGDLSCEHVPGRTYAGELCVRIVDEVDLQEISLTPHPDDPRCYRVASEHTTEQLSRLENTRLHEGSPFCTHCAMCDGAEAGPTANDLDPGRWSDGPRPPCCRR